MCPVGMVCIPALWFGVGVTAGLFVIAFLVFLVIGAAS